MKSWKTLLSVVLCLALLCTTIGALLVTAADSSTTTGDPAPNRALFGENTDDNTNTINDDGSLHVKRQAADTVVYPPARNIFAEETPFNTITVNEDNSLHVVRKRETTVVSSDTGYLEVLSPLKLDGLHFVVENISHINDSETALHEDIFTFYITDANKRNGDGGLTVENWYNAIYGNYAGSDQVNFAPVGSGDYKDKMDVRFRVDGENVFMTINGYEIQIMGTDEQKELGLSLGLTNYDEVYLTFGSQRLGSGSSYLGLDVSFDLTVLHEGECATADDLNMAVAAPLDGDALVGESNNDNIVTENSDGSLHVVREASGTAVTDLQLVKSFKLDGLHFVVDNFVRTDETNISSEDVFTFYLTDSDKRTPKGGLNIEVWWTDYVLYYTPNNGQTIAFTSTETFKDRLDFRFAVDENNDVIMTINGQTINLTAGDITSGITDFDEVYLTIASQYVENTSSSHALQKSEFDIIMLHDVCVEEMYVFQVQAVETLEKAIDALGEITVPEQNAQVEKLRAQYINLSSAQKAIFNDSKLADLVAAENKIIELQEKDQIAIDTVIELISKFDARNVTLEDEAIVKAAQDAYDALRNDELRSRVGVYAVELLVARSWLETLKEVAADAESSKDDTSEINSTQNSQVESSKDDTSEINSTQNSQVESSENDVSNTDSETSPVTGVLPPLGIAVVILLSSGVVTVTRRRR